MPVGAEDIPECYREKFLELSKEIEFCEQFFNGANGVVVRGVNKVLKRPVVVKFYYYDDGVHVEPEILARMESDNILTVDNAGAFNNEYAYFVSRYCERGNLDSFMLDSAVSIRNAVEIVTQVAAGVSYLHGRGYLHRDLKPSNIFQENNRNFVIGDFGSVVQTRDEGFAEALTKHSIIYRPPEDFDGNKFYRQGDIYQLGICLYQTLGGVLPYEVLEWLSAREQARYIELDEVDASVFANSVIERCIKQGKVIKLDTLPACVPACLRRIIRKAANINKEKRYETAADFIAALNNVNAQVHDWRSEEGTWTLYRPKFSYRYINDPNGIIVQKRRRGGDWRRQHIHNPANEKEAVALIEGAV